jgi:hypothetical protein
MSKVKEKIEEALEDIAYAESGEFHPHHKKAEETDSLEDIFAAIGMAEGGEEEYVKRLHPLFQLKHGKN